MFLRHSYFSFRFSLFFQMHFYLMNARSVYYRVAASSPPIHPTKSIIIIVMNSNHLIEMSRAHALMGRI